MGCAAGGFAPRQGKADNRVLTWCLHNVCVASAVIFHPGGDKRLTFKGTLKIWEGKRDCSAIGWVMLKKNRPRGRGRFTFSLCKGLRKSSQGMGQLPACKAGVLPLNYPPDGVPATRGIVYKEMSLRSTLKLKERIFRPFLMNFHCRRRFPIIFA